MDYISEVQAAAAQVHLLAGTPVGQGSVLTWGMLGGLLLLMIFMMKISEGR